MTGARVVSALPLFELAALDSEKLPGRSLELAALVALAGPLDLLVR